MHQFSIIILILIFTFIVPVHAQENAVASQSGLASARIGLDFNIRDSVDNIGNLYIHYPSQHPTVWTFVNNDGSVSVCTMDSNEKKTYVYEMSMNLETQKTMTFPNEYDMLGAFTKDNDGNYYFFYAQRGVNQNTENMAVVKFNGEGEKLNTYKLRATPPSSFGGVRVPFDAGTCRLELSGSMLAVYFAREMFNGHQASYGFIIDKDTFQRIDTGAATNAERRGGISQMPYSSHSFNQFILPIEDGFLFADHGDAYPRNFTFAKFIRGRNTMRVHAYRFVGNIGANATYAEMGGVAKTSAGYIFLGACGRGSINNPRNLVVVTFDDEMNACSSPNYITSYTRDNGHAGHPKIVQIGSGRYLILWELFNFSTQAANLLTRTQTGYKSTYTAVIDERGAFVSEIREIGNIRLSMNDVLRYNSVINKVYWAINDSPRSITVYALDAE